VIVPTGSDGVLRPDDVARAIAATDGPLTVAATAGTTDHGSVDPLPELASVAAEHGAFFHVDAAYGGGLLFSDHRRHLLAGLDRADTVALDLHKFGWQPLAAGVLAVRDAAWLAPMSITADYLNADDDVEAGLPPLLGRSIRTSRRADVLKLAVTFHALGRTGLGALVDRCCDLATAFAAAVDDRPGLRLHRRPTLSTVVFRPAAADRLGPAAGNALVAEVRRRLLHEGTAVVGRATVPGPAPDAPAVCWLKVTLLNPQAGKEHLEALLDLIERATDHVLADLG
jgi:L-2,4-diaminobutyrate decarboxylase